MGGTGTRTDDIFLESGALAANDELRLTLNNGTVISVDLSALDGANASISGVTFQQSTRQLTINTTAGESFSASIPQTSITGLAFNGTTGALTATLSDGSSETANLSALDVGTVVHVNNVGVDNPDFLDSAAVGGVSFDVEADGTITALANADLTPSWVPASDPGYLTTPYTNSDAQMALAISDDDANQLTYTDRDGAQQTWSPTGTYSDLDAQAALNISDDGHILTYRDRLGNTQMFRGGLGIDYITTSSFPVNPNDADNPIAAGVEYAISVTNLSGTDLETAFQLVIDGVNITGQGSLDIARGVPAGETAYFYATRSAIEVSNIRNNFAGSGRTATEVDLSFGPQTNPIVVRVRDNITSDINHNTRYEFEGNGDGTFSVTPSDTGRRTTYGVGLSLIHI